MRSLLIVFGIGFPVALLLAQTTLPQGDPRRGARLFRLRQCAACHTLRPGEHLIGPSLAGVWGRKAGTLEGYGRYSDALKNARLVWNEETLDQFLEDPQRFIPNTLMKYPGVRDLQARADLIAYLKAVSDYYEKHNSLARPKS